MEVACLRHLYKYSFSEARTTDEIARMPCGYKYYTPTLLQQGTPPQCWNEITNILFVSSLSIKCHDFSSLHYLQLSGCCGKLCKNATAPYRTSFLVVTVTNICNRRRHTVAYFFPWATLFLILAEPHPASRNTRRMIIPAQKITTCQQAWQSINTSIRNL